MTSGRGAPLQLPSDEPWWGSGAPWTGSWWSSAATCSLRSWSSGSEASRWNQGAQFLHEEPGEETQGRYTASKAPRQLGCLQPKATCLLPPPPKHHALRGSAGTTFHGWEERKPPPSPQQPKLYPALRSKVAEVMIFGLIIILGHCCVSF